MKVSFEYTKEEYKKYLLRSRIISNIVLFIIQHKMISADNLKNVKIASYSINQVISIVFLLSGLIDCLI